MLLVVCIWACGASYSELPLTLGLILYGVGRILTIIQVTPGGVGVTEIIYTSVFVAVLGESANDAVVAGVLRLPGADVRSCLSSAALSPT